VFASVLTYLNFSGEGLVKLYGQILLMSTLATLLPYAFCSLAVFLPGGRRGTVGTTPTIIALLAFAYALFAIYGAGHETVFWGFLLTVSGLPVYVWVTRQRRPPAA
jgi:APA family basic amino acid/polyamine antiporter